ncbi:DUF4395 domain-containing protein [Aquipuribacter nitratireducens]|uniref:DUF4395 domain-containing protein n=1 Tax=Aquipuribacter nitratireducens TaxID=650104 RepID=A0ABW0GNZ2_9MICO
MSAAVAGTALPPRPPGAVDPRGPRFAAAMTSLVLAATVLTGSVVLLGVQALLFAVTVVLGVGRGPWAWLFRGLVRPRLAPPTWWEDPAAPRFAQLVGLVVVGAGLLLAAAGVPWAVVGAAAAALVAAGLNAVFGICLGCALYRALPRRRL